MATFADYDVISDNKVSLKIGGDIDHDFPIGLQTGANIGQRSVLSFMVDAVSPDDLQFRLSIVNGNNVNTDIITITSSSSVARVFQEVINANVLTVSGSTLKVKVLSGSGTLEISDIVLLYKRND